MGFIAYFVFAKLRLLYIGDFEMHGILLAAAILLASLSPVQAETKLLTLDLGHAFVGWEIDHFGYSNTVGQFRQFDGEFLVDEQQLDKSQIRFTIQVESIDSNHVGRDNHLRAKDMLDVMSYPTIEFVSTSILMNSSQSGSITGDLSFMGTTESFSLEFVITDDSKFAEFLPRYDQLRAIGFEARGRLDRIAHGFDALHFPGSPLGQYIDLNIHFDLVDCAGAPENNIPCQYRRNEQLEFPNE